MATDELVSMRPGPAEGGPGRDANSGCLLAALPLVFAVFLASAPSMRWLAASAWPSMQWA